MEIGGKMKNSLRCVSPCTLHSHRYQASELRRSASYTHLMLGAVHLPLELPEQLLEPDCVPDLLLRHVTASLRGAEVEAAVVTLGIIQTPCDRDTGDRVRGY